MAANNPVAVPEKVLPTADAAGVRGNESRGEELLHELFEWRAELTPAAVAIVCGSSHLTYAAVEARANQLARFLRAQGVSRGDCVGLLLPRSTDVLVGLLAILKAGGCYVPLDAEYPAERVGFILADCRARALLTTPALGGKAGGFTGNTIELDRCHVDISVEASHKLGRAETGIRPEDLCYVIYTSGTTGKPKGVQIEHRSVCHFVRAEAEIFRITPADRVFQGFSIAFDASVEEIWLAFFAGATLVIGSQEMVRSGAAFARMLTEAGVTVLSCVPTLLSMVEDDMPLVRLLILGGEACAPDLVRRWWKPGRRVVNTYGPTEATVVATYADCHPDKPVTIGRPLPNYTAAILDGQMRPVVKGVAGELCLGGVGLARGYLGRPELNREKFILFDRESRVCSAEGEGVMEGSGHGHGAAARMRLYRTGDLARWTSDGEIEFLGRIDTQVKIRGFRVELGEIESVLLENPDVKAAAVALREDTPGMQQLVGYIVPREGARVDANTLRASLRSRLPAYMVPAVLETLTELPTLASGKIDRGRLPTPSYLPTGLPGEIVGRSTTERQIAAVWARLFTPLVVSVTDDFFLDLGGHSLLAARMVSELRGNPALAQVSMLDVYQHTTIASLAASLEARGTEDAASASSSVASATLSGDVKNSAPELASAAPQPKGTAPVPFWRHFICGAAQLASLVFVLSFFALQWLAPYLTYTILVEEEYDFLEAILGAFASLVVLYPIMLAIPIAIKWTVIGRYKPGAYPLWGTYYFRWWLVTTIEAAVPVGYLSGTPLLNIYFRLMGARIGSNVYLGSENFAIYDLVSIDDDSSINVDSNLPGYSVEKGWLKVGRINVGKRCFVGARAAVGPDTAMEDDAALEELSLLPRGTTIPRGETWAGSPATPVNRALRGEDPLAVGGGLKARTPSRARRAAFGVLHGIGLLVFPVLVVAALFPGIVVMNKLNYIDPYYWYLLLAPLVGVSFVALLALEIAAVKWLLLGRVKPGSHPLDSFYYLRKWFVDQTMDLSLDVLGPLYASVYLKPWYLLLGAKLGKGAEVSTASFISPDLLTIGDESFVADSVSLGAPRVRDGWRTLGKNQIGQRSFIGNGALLPPDTTIGDNVLIGCLSVPPKPADALRQDTTWLGSPAIFLPQRQKNTAFSEETTFNPPASLRAQRAAIEFVRVIAPSTCFIILISLLFSAVLLLRDRFSLLQTLMFFPFLYAGCGVAATLAAILAKWALVWRYRPGEKPLWSTFVWRNELLNALHEHLAEPFLVGALTGTPFICWYFRLLGARIGRRVYMETTDLSEFDLVTIGDEAALNADCTIQTHLFEDRVMKISSIEIGAGCRVGAGSLVLYDTRMEPGSSLGALSLLMKGEMLPAGTGWEGVPARKQGAVTGGVPAGILTGRDSSGSC